MRILVLVLLLLLGWLQYRIWVGEGSLAEVAALRREIEVQTGELERLGARNRRLQAEVEDLRLGQSALEERARSELGMIKEGEIFLQVIDPPAADLTAKAGTPAPRDPALKKGGKAAPAPKAEARPAPATADAQAKAAAKSPAHHAARAEAGAPPAPKGGPKPVPKSSSPPAAPKGEAKAASAPKMEAKAASASKGEAKPTSKSANNSQSKPPPRAEAKPKSRPGSRSGE